MQSPWLRWSKGASWSSPYARSLEKGSTVGSTEWEEKTEDWVLFIQGGIHLSLWAMACPDPNTRRLNVAMRGARAHIWFPCCHIYPVLFWTFSVISAPNTACILSSPLRPGLCEKPGRRENFQTGHSSIREVKLLPLVHVAREKSNMLFLDASSVSWPGSHT